MHDIQRVATDRFGRMIYQCMREDCGERIAVPVAGSGEWHRDPKSEVVNTILRDERLRRLEVAADCPAAPAGIEPLKSRARRRRRTRRYRAGYVRAGYIRAA